MRRTTPQVPGQSCVVVDPSARLRNFQHENRETSERLLARYYGEFLEEMLQELAHRVRSEQQDCG